VNGIPTRYPEFLELPMMYLIIALLSAPAWAQAPLATFSASYQQEQRGRWTAEVSEVRELLNIVVAISPEGLAGDLLALHNQMQKEDPLFKEYYRDAMKAFLPYYNEPIVRLVNQKLEAGSREEFYALTNLMAYTRRFSGERLVPTHIHEFFTSDGTHNYERSKLEPTFVEFFRELESFSMKAGFRRFFAAHRKFYASLEERYRQRTNIKRMWHWLEQRFPLRVDSYRVLISPLVYRFHTTGGNGADGFTEIVMAMSAPDKSTDCVQLERAVFTEIDENYANPVSAKHLEEIRAGVGDKRRWATEAALHYYSSEKDVFTEYLTWALFLLYARDEYSAEQQEQARQLVNGKMRQRGFLLFSEFGEMLLKLYPAHGNAPIESYYPQILDWMRKH